MKIRTARRISQVFFFSLFLFFVVISDLRYLKGYPVSLFLELDPLVSFATAITTHTIYKGLLWSLLLLIPTILLGRIFCNWICPYGILHHFMGWLLGKGRAEEKERIESNRYRSIYQIKYIILIGMIVAALFGSLQIGLLDPICLFHRSMTTAILPAANLVAPSTFYVKQPFAIAAWVIGFLLFLLVGMNVVIPRFFCRVLCPLGAFLGTISSAALWRIERNPSKCVDCDLCLKNCEGASDPHTQLRKSECFVCFNCIEDCPEDALSFKFVPPLQHEITMPAVQPRRALLGAAVGFGFFGFGRASGDQDRGYNKDVDSAAWLGRGKGIPRTLHQVRPVHPRLSHQCAAARAIHRRPRRDLDAHPRQQDRLLRTELHPVRPGLSHGRHPAHFHRGKDRPGQIRRAGPGPSRHGLLRPWPLPAVEHGDAVRGVRRGLPRVAEGHFLARSHHYQARWHGHHPAPPYVDPALCIGCGICEHECPVTDEPAIRVSAVGETRSRDRRLLMDGGITSAPRDYESKQR